MSTSPSPPESPTAAADPGPPDPPAAPPEPAGASRLSRRRLLGGGALGLVAAAGSAGWLYARAPATPWYVTDGPANVRQSYAYAVAHPEVLRHIPCYCDCGRTEGHRRVLDCFVADRDLFDRPRYDDHGVGCHLCVAVVLDARDRIAAGKTLAETRAEIDAFYAPYANWATDTPHPPHHADGESGGG